MAGSEVVVKYYSQRMLETVDVQVLIRVILDSFGQESAITFSPTDENEKGRSSQMIGEILAIEDRFLVLEVKDGHSTRHREIEDMAIHLGQK